jgi:DNA adenine methylase
MKSPIIYYGGKTTMLQHILPIIPPHDVYTETFLGGGAVYWAKTKSNNETINDRLDIVINFYQQLKNNFKGLKKLIDATVFSRTLHARALFAIKNKDMFDGLQLAWAFWVTSNFSYSNKIGGGLKYSNDMSMVPPRVMTNMKREFTEVLVQRIENAHIENRDAIQILQSRNVTNAFHYIDPPYPDTEQGHYHGYGFDEFELLLQACERLRGKFLLSNRSSKMLDEYIVNNNWWKREFIISNNGKRKGDKINRELLVANYIPVGAHELF